MPEDQPTKPKNKGGRPRKSDAKPATITFDEAVNRLPATAILSIEIDWIRAHPAFHRKPNSNGFIELIVDDVIEVSEGYCQHPIAPSKSAVNMLKYYLQHEDELYKLLTGGANKKGAPTAPVGGAPEEDEDADVDVSDIQKYLNQLKD